MLTIEEAIEFHRKRCALSEVPAFDQRLKRDYDGLHGMLPPQFNDEQKGGFLTTREHVFRINKSLNFEITVIIEAINSWCEHYNNKSQPMNLSDEISEYIKDLGYFKYQFLLNRDELLSKTLGEGARKVYTSIQQSEAASKPRQDELQKIITNELENSPNATWKEILKRLKSHTEFEITDDSIKWIERGKNKSAAISGLKDRVSRAKNN
jgi:hypothetical protein